MDDYIRQTQVFSDSQPPPTPGYVTPSPLSPQGPPRVARLPNPEGNYPNDPLRSLVEDQIIPKFEELYGLIGEANTLATKEVDAKFWSPVLRKIQEMVSGFVPAIGARRKSRRRRSRR